MDLLDDLLIYPHRSPAVATLPMVAVPSIPSTPTADCPPSVLNRHPEKKIQNSAYFMKKFVLTKATIS